MMHDDEDDLDRALFALPLAETPAGLRESILRATIHAPASAPAAFGRVETIAIGVLLAVAAWLAICTGTNPHAAASLELAVSSLVRGLADPATIVWLSVGALTAVALSQAGSPRLPFRNGRA